MKNINENDESLYDDGGIVYTGRAGGGGSNDPFLTALLGWCIGSIIMIVLGIAAAAIQIGLG